MDRKFAVIGFVLFIMGCTTTQEIKRPDGQTEYLIACGASLGWNVCYKKANKICPTGYTTVAEHVGFNRKELRIACPAVGRKTNWHMPVASDTFRFFYTRFSSPKLDLGTRNRQSAIARESSDSRLRRVAQAARAQVNQGCYQQVYDALDDLQRQSINGLLTRDEQETTRPWQRLKRLKREPRQPMTKRIRSLSH